MNMTGGLLPLASACAAAIATAAALTAAPASAQTKPMAKPLVAIETPNVPPARQFRAGGSWSAGTAAPFGAGTPLQLTDGRVLVHESCTSNWWTLTPNTKGSYVKGKWKKVKSMQAGYAPLYFSSAVLADGRVIVNGGEYNDANDGKGCDAVWTTKGAIYDPVKNKWTTVAPPAGWTSIGDAQNVVLPDGRFWLADCCSAKIAEFNPTNRTWSSVPVTGKIDGTNNEEGWTLLPDGSFVTVDAFTGGSTSHAERYASNQWNDAGNTVKLNASFIVCDEQNISFEVGPAVLMPNGKVFAVGATGHSAVYTPPSNPLGTGSWAAGPDFPVITGGHADGSADGPAALMPNGNVLMMTSPCVFHTPSHFFEYNGSSLTRVSEPPNAPFNSSYYGRLMVLPTGQVLLTDGSGDVEIYTPKGNPKSAWQPTVTSFPSSVNPGGIYKLTGQRLNGLSQASVYGDDSSSATNYPLVRITHNATGTVTYARTFNHTSMGVAVTGKTSTKVAIADTTPTGASMLEVVANGIASAGFPIQVVAASAVASRRPPADED